MSGQLKKLIIKAFKDGKFTSAAGEFELPINPETYSQRFAIEYDNTTPPGSHGNDPKFLATTPQSLDLSFVFDGTGVIPNNPQEGKSVSEQIEDFLDIVYDMEGSIHRPKYLKILWGSLAFDCILSNLDIEYTLFKPDGQPLRAKLKANFESFIEASKRVKEEGKNSPDLTHMRTVQEGETLLYMVNNIYKDPSYYLEVARVNGLTNFRNLAVGTQLIFPPVDKSSE